MAMGPGFNHYYDPNYYVGDFPPVQYGPHYNPGFYVGDFPNRPPGFSAPMVDPMARIAELEARIAALEANNVATNDAGEDHNSFSPRTFVLHFDLGEDTLDGHRNRLDDLLDEIVPAIEDANFGFINYYWGEFSIETVSKNDRAYPETINFIENEAD